MTAAFDDVLTANDDYASRFALGDLEGKAARGLAVVLCIDSRIEPLQMLGLSPGDAKILRNAGARVTDDVLRNLVVAHHALGVDRVLVVAHTDCGMAKNDDAAVHGIIERNLGVDARSLELDTIPDQQAALERGVQRIRSSPYLPAGLPVAGAIYDVRTGRLEVTVP